MEELLDKYYEAKQKADDYSEKVEKYRKQIIKNMEKDNEKSYKGDKYTCKLKNTKTERINKTTCPKDIWEEYKKVGVYKSIEIKKS
jgi:hypothetical protein